MSIQVTIMLPIGSIDAQAVCCLSQELLSEIIPRTYITAIVRDAPRRARLQNIIISICVSAVFPRLLIRLFLILVAMVG